MTREKKKYDLAAICFSIVFFLLCMIGIFSIVQVVWQKFRVIDGQVYVEMTPESLGQPGVPTAADVYEVHDMNATLKGIERQLERMNETQSKIYGEVERRNDHGY